MSTQIRIGGNLVLPVDVVTQTIGVLAKRRAGKSYTARKFTEEIFKAGEQVIIVDSKGDWWGIRSSADGKRAGLPVVILGGERGDVPLESSGGELVARLVVEEHVSALLDLSLLRKSEVATFMTAFMEAFYRLKARETYRTPVMLVIDEADAIAPQKPYHGDERMLGAAEDIVRRGGQRGIGCMLITQRSAVLNKNVLTQIQILVALRTIAPSDLKAIKEWVDVHGSEVERYTLMESLPSLAVGDAWFWSPGWPKGDGIFERVSVGEIETFDSGSTPVSRKKRVEPKTIADVDLDAVKRQMSETMERAKASDPKLLQKRIRELESELVICKAKAPPTEVPVLEGADLKRVERAFVRLEKLHQQSAVAEEGLAKELQDLRTSLLALRQFGLGEWKPESGVRFVPVNSPSPKADQHRNGDLSRSRPQQLMLDMLASLATCGIVEVPRATVAVLADQSPRSSGFSNNLSFLRSSGLVEYGSGGTVRLTNQGLGCAESSWVPILGELHSAWKAKLTNPQARMIDVLIRSRNIGVLVERDALAVQSGQSPTSSGYANNLSALKSIGLIHYPMKGQVAPTSLLFPAGL